jgi:hypothetical protein
MGVSGIIDPEKLKDLGDDDLPGNWPWSIHQAMMLTK